MDPIQCFGREKLEPALDVEESSFLGPFKHSPFLLSLSHLNEKKGRKKKLYAHPEQSARGVVRTPGLSMRARKTQFPN